MAVITKQGALKGRLRGFCRAIALATGLFCPLLAVRGDILYDNGPPGLTNGSEMTHWIDANQFTVNSSIYVGSVNFWTIEASASFFGTMYWEIRTNNPDNTPGQTLYIGLTSPSFHNATGRLAFNYPEYAVNFAFPAGLFLGPGNYWFHLHNGPLTNNVSRDVFWEAANTTNTTPSLDDVYPFTNFWQSNGANSQLAFQLVGVASATMPRITAVQKSGTTYRLSFTTTSGRNYRVEYKNSLTDASWTTVSGASNIGGNGGVMQIIDDTTGLQKRFYRVVLL